MTDIITSLQNDKVKLAVALQNRPRARRKEHKIVLEGTRLVRDAVQSQQKAVYVLYEPESANYELIAQLQNQQATLIGVSKDVIKHVADTKNPQGIIGVFHMPVPPLPQNPSRLLILDGISDPGNMGTMLRTAAAAGVEAVVLSPGCTDPYNPKSLRSGMGAHFRIPIVEASWDEIKNYCTSLAVYTTSGKATLAYDDVNWLTDWAIVIGSEAHGVSDNAKNLASELIHIPMYNKTESLNASIAAGVVLFEAARQRKNPATSK